MESMLELTFMSGSRDGEKVQLQLKNELNQVVIGRVQECDICCPSDPEMSRRHARLLRDSESNTWQLEDLNSTNGTYIGEFKQAQRIREPVSLACTEVFRVGRTCLRIELTKTMEMTAEAYAKIEQ